MSKSFRVIADIIKATSNEKEFIVDGYAATKDLDRQGDIILLDALAQAATQLKEVNNTVFFGHSYDLASSVGKIVDATVDDKGLKVKIFVSSTATELRTKISEGIINKFSIGGKVVLDSFIPREEALTRGLMGAEAPFCGVRMIEKMDLFEVSFVGVPANPNAQVVGSFSKAIEGVYQDEVKGGEGMKKEGQEEVKKEEASVVPAQSTVETPAPVVEEAPKVEEKKEPTPEVTETEKKTEEPVKVEKSVESTEEVRQETVKELEPELDLKAMVETFNSISKKVDTLEGFLKTLIAKAEELEKAIAEKVQVIQITAEKKSLVKAEDPLKMVEKKQSEEASQDPDVAFLKFLRKQ